MPAIGGPQDTTGQDYETQKHLRFPLQDEQKDIMGTVRPRSVTVFKTDFPTPQPVSYQKLILYQL